MKQTATPRTAMAVWHKSTAAPAHGAAAAAALPRSPNQQQHHLRVRCRPRRANHQQIISLAATAVADCASISQDTAAHQRSQLQYQRTDANSGAAPSSSSSSSSSGASLQQVLLQLRRQPSCRAAPYLTCAIKATTTWHEASQVFSEHSAAFNHIHTAALISHLPKVLRRQRQSLPAAEQSDVSLLLQDLALLAEEVLQHCSGRELANMAHGFAAAGFYSRRLMQLLLGRCDLRTLKPQELANLTWAVAKQGHEMHEGWTSEVLALSQRHMQNCGFKPQEVTNIAWALAVMQRQCRLACAPPLRHCCTRVDGTWKADFCRAASGQLQAYQAPDVAMGLWALAVLGFSEVQQDWLEQQLGRATQLVGDMQPRHIAVVLWSVSQLQRQHQAQQQQQAKQQQHYQQQQRLYDIIQSSLCGPGAASSNSAEAAAASSSTTNSSGYLQRFGSACFPRLQQQLPYESQQLPLVSIVLLASAHLQLRPPPDLMQDLLAAAAAQLRQHTAMQLAAVQQSARTASSSSGSAAGAAGQSLTSAVRTGQQQQQQQQHQVGQVCITYGSSGLLPPQQQQQVRLYDVTVLLFSLARLGYRPSREFMAAATHAAALTCWQQGIATASSSSRCSSDAHKPHHHQQQHHHHGVAAAAAVVPAVKGKEVSLLLWGMAKLRYKPAPVVLKLLLRAAVQQLHSFTASDVGLMFWALARMRADTSTTWTRGMLRHFLARLDDGLNTAPDVCNVVHALPHLPGGKNLNRLLVAELGGLLPQLAGAAQQRLSDCGPRELVQLVQGFARLGFRPDRVWLQQHQQRCEEVGPAQFCDRERRALLAARAKLEQQPEQAAAVKEQQLSQGQERAELAVAAAAAR